MSGSQSAFSHQQVLRTNNFILSSYRRNSFCIIYHNS
uniref:Uncharacterized protein n=1 Tax=Arundo donax TaxID=35708 RepID=A0A0A8Y1E4_ARUDO